MELWTRWNWADAVDGWLDEMPGNVFSALPNGERVQKNEYDPQSLADYVDGCFDCTLPLADAKEIVKMVESHANDAAEEGTYSWNYNKLMQEVREYQLSKSEYAQCMNAIENGKVIDGSEGVAREEWLVEYEYDMDKPGYVPVKSAAFILRDGPDEHIEILNDMQGAYPKSIDEVSEYDWRPVYELD